MRRHAKAATAGSISGSAKRTPVLVVLATLVLALTASPALAIETHPFLGSFGSASQPSFGEPQGVAVDQPSGDVLVMDAGTISRYNPDGSPDEFSATGSNVIDGQGSGDETPQGGLSFASPSESQIAVDNSGTATDGNIYVTQSSPNVINVFSAEGEYLGQLSETSAGPFSEACGVAVDPTGAVYVGDYSSGIHKFVPSANPPLNTDYTATFTTVGSPCTLAAGTGASAGFLFAATYNGAVSKLDASSGAVQYVAAEGSTTTVSVDPSDGHLYAAKESEVFEYDASGASSATQVSSFSPGSHIRGIAAAGDVYASRAGASHVEVFGPVAQLPVATTEAAAEVKKTTATLNGTVSADGGPDATCEFQYTTEASFQAEGFAGASTAPCSPAGPFSGSAVEAVSAAVSGLTAANGYRFRLLATNENGSNPGEALSFETPGAVNLKTGSTSNLAPTAATFHGTINPESVELEECLFEYGESESYGQTIACAETPAQIGAGETPVAVHADVSGLTPNTRYHFRLKAKNTVGTSLGADESFTTFGPPRIGDSFASPVGLTDATIQGLVNPDGLATTYLIQYVSDADFQAGEWADATSVPVGGEAIGSGTEDVKVARQLTGLSPATTYHFRFVAANSAGTVDSPDATFVTYKSAAVFGPCGNDALRTGPGVALPDCRAYEQATPVSKNGNDPIGGLNFTEASEAGDAITFEFVGGAPGADGAQNFPSFLARRGTTAWSSAGIHPPATSGQAGAVQGWTRDLKTVFNTATTFTPAAVINTFLARDTGDRSVEQLAMANAQYVSSSRDGSKVYFETTKSLAAGAAAGFKNLYVVDRNTGTIRLAGLLPGNLTPSEGSFAGPYNVSFGDPGFGGELLGSYLQDNHVVSEDGGDVFFTAAGTGQLYLRRDAASPTASTQHVSASQKTNGSGPGGIDPNGPQPAAFRTATPDASTVLFTSSEELTDDANTGAADEGNDLYAYDTNAEALTDLTVDSGDANGADVQGVIGTSEDLSYVYFAANGVLAAGATPGDCEGDDPNTFAGSCSIYLWHDGDITYIARVTVAAGITASDAFNWSTGSQVGGSAQASTGRVTPDGRTLLFSSKRRLTAYDNSSGCGPEGEDPCTELYRYRVSDPALLCVSCNPTGVAPTGVARVQSMHGPLIASPAATRTRNLSVSGDQVFFETSDKLLAADTNGDQRCVQGNNINGLAGSTCQDVYEWEAQGAGSCHSSADNGGCLYLISTGRSPAPSYFADASLSGDDVFFFTREKLVPQDQDGNMDIYDAHVGGGLPSQHPSSLSLCSGEAACRPSSPAPQAAPSPGTATFVGPGNQGKKRHGAKPKSRKCKKHKRKCKRARGAKTNRGGSK